nr:hypothetical protein [uncultured Pseudomonas sp.]
MGKVEAIKMLVSGGRAKDVLDLLEGESSYISDASEGVPQEPELRRLWIVTVHHLRFVSDFGNSAIEGEKDGKHLTPFPDEFERWLSVGAPGIAPEDIDSLLRNHPV